jgi:hypothetical protein
MAESGRYLIGETARQKLRSTIEKVDSLAFGGPVSRIPTVIEGDAATPAAKVFRIGIFTGEWEINSSKTVTLRNVTTTPNTVSAVNLFTRFTASTATTTCAVAKDGTAWYLIAPMAPSGGGVFRGTYSGAWPNGGSIKMVTEDGTGERYEVRNWLTPISGSGGPCVFGLAGGQYVLINFDLTKLAGYQSGSCVLGSEGNELKWFDTVICT